MGAVRVRNPFGLLWVRRAARGSKWQARPHTGPSRSDNFNLGLYPSEELAHRIAVRFAVAMANMKRDHGEACPAAVLVELQAAGLVRPEVCPRWVRKQPDGSYVASHPRVGTLAGFDSPVTAYRAILALVHRTARAHRLSQLEAALAG